MAERPHPELPNAQVEQVDNGGHLLLVDQPDIVAGLTERFLRHTGPEINVTLTLILFPVRKATADAKQGFYVLINMFYCTRDN